MNPDPLEPLASIPETLTGWSHFSKTALPLLGRVGTVVGGVFSLLAVFEKISGEIVTTIEGFVLVVAVLSSGIVLFNRAWVILADQKKLVYTYSRRARAIAGIVLAISSILLVFFLLRLWMPNIPGARIAGGQGKQTPTAGFTRTAERGGGKPGATPAPNTVIPTAIPTSTPTPTWTPTNPVSSTPSRAATLPATLPPAKTATATPTILDQITDVNLLLKLGNDALDLKKYSQATSIFTRATFIEATNALAQYGLGQAYFYQNNLNQATEPFQNALRLNANLHDAHAYLGWIYDYRQDKAKAIAEYDVFLKAAPRDDPLRPEILDRERQLTSSTPAPTLTPIGGTPASSPTTRLSPTATPTLTSIPNK